MPHEDPEVAAEALREKLLAAFKETGTEAATVVAVVSHNPEAGGAEFVEGHYTIDDLVGTEEGLELWEAIAEEEREDAMKILGAVLSQRLGQPAD